MKVLIKYTLIFEPDDYLRKKYDVDAFIAKAFESAGYESELITTGEEIEGETMVFLNRVEVNTPEPKPKTPRSQKFLASRKVG